MKTTFDKIIRLVREGKVLISEHGYNELSADNIFIRDIIEGVKNALVVEDYPSYYKGPCVLILSYDRNLKPIHAVWGMPKKNQNVAVLVTAYRPDPELWEDDFVRRRK